MLRSSGLLALMSLAAASLAQRSTHTQVTLETALTAVAPDQEALIGIRFKIDDGWHTYWRNAGESGSPATIKWIAPEGITFGDILWPLPERIVVSGDTSYGYRHEVVLLVPVKVAASMKAGTNVDIKAAIDYVVCHDLCITASAAPTMTLAIGPGTASPVADDLAQWQLKVPRPAPPEWKAQASVAPKELLLTVDTGHAETTASFLPFQNGLIADGASQTADLGPAGVTLHLKKSAMFSKSPASLDGVLILPVGAFEIRAPLQ
jgi:DsbC/DsbD-like thiol-disulfide interchange protein